MAHTFKIKLVGGEMVEQEPVVGRWYCAANIVGTADPYVDLGVLGEYIGNGEFDDEGTDVTFAMRDCDYLQEQVH